MSKVSEYLKNIFLVILLIQFVPPVVKHLKKEYLNTFAPGNRVACVSIKEVICSSSYAAYYLKTYFKDPSIKAIILRIDSPGGAAGSSEAIAHELVGLKKLYPKPIISLTENVCASGAYYVAATTDYIIAAPSTLVGSIGAIIPYQFRFKDFLAQYHIGYESIKAGTYKNITDPFAEHPADHTKFLEQLAQSSYENFVHHVIKNRPALKTTDQEAWAQGKIFTGNQALDLGLIDAVGSWSDAEVKIKILAGISDQEKIEWVSPVRHISWWNLLKNDDSDGYDPSSPQDTSLAFACLKTFFEFIESRYCLRANPQAIHF